MLELLALVAPLGLAAALSPVMFSEQVVLVGRPHGRRLGSAYAAGAVVVAAAVVVVVSLVGHQLQLPRAPHLDAGTDLAVGSALLLAATVMLRRRATAPEPAPRSPRPMKPSRALGFGAFSMATNLTTLALLVVATKDVSASGLSAWERLLPLVLLVGLATVPAWLPPALAGWPRVASLLTRVAALATQHSRAILTAILLLTGAYLLVRGAVTALGS